MEFGKLCSWEKQGNRVVFQFEKRTGRVEILTPEIFNVFSGVVSEEHRSKAIEGDKSVAVDFTAAEADGVVEISTDAVTARIYDDFKVDFYKADGTVLCRDYRGSRKICAGLSDELKALKEAEGHRCAVMATDETKGKYICKDIVSAGHKDDELSVARNLYAILRDFDKQNIEFVYSESFETKNVGQAVMNRLIKAAGHKIIKLD